MNTSKPCKQCGKVCESLEERRRWWRGHCRDCRREYQRGFKYGLSLDELRQVLQNHDGQCDICGRSVNHLGGRDGGGARLDHDHRTGKFRGILCHKCNCGLGFFDDDSGKLAKAIVYLQERA